MVSLHDANGAYVGEALFDQDMAESSARDLVIDSDGKIYVWKQRNAQWRESAGVVTPTSVEVAAPEEAVAAEGPVESAQEYNEEWASASNLIAQAKAATTTEELDDIEAQAEGRVTVSNAVAARREELG